MAAFPLVPLAARSKPAHSASPQSQLSALLDADRSFSRDGGRRGLDDAFARMFAKDVLVVVPGKGFVRGAAPAIASLPRDPANPAARVEWAPVTGGISADGSHGFTMGFLQMAKVDGGSRGFKYLAYWIRGREGWRVALYRMTAKPAGGAPGASIPLSLPAISKGAEPRAGSRESLIAAESAFSRDAQRSGIGNAFRHFGTAASINTGGGPNFLLGAEAIARHVEAGTGGEAIRWAAEDAIVAPSGDFGVTWGRIHIGNPPPPGPGIAYFTIWRRNSDGWRYIAE